MATLDEVRAQAEAALAAGEHEVAESLGLLMRRHFPHDYQTTRLLGKVYLETHRVGEAVDAFRDVLEADPEDVVTWSALAIVAEEEGDLDSAVEYFERAFDIDPGNHEIAAEIARLHSQLSHTKAPEPGSSMHSMARRFLIEGKYESALPWLQEALRITPDSAEVGVGLARALWQSWRAKEAEDVALEVVAKHPSCLRALAIAAAAANSRGGDGGLAILEKTESLDPGNAIARSFFANAGISFPERAENLVIPDSELRDALENAASEAESSAPVQSAEIGGEPEPAAESEPLGTAEPEDTPPLVFEEPVRQETPEPAAAAEIAPAEDEPNPLLRRLSALRKAAVDEESAQADLSSSTFPEEELMAGSGAPTLGEPILVGAAETAPSAPGEVLTADASGEENAGGSAQDHITAGAGFADQGLVDEAVAEYRIALKKDPSTAPDITEAVLALAESNPGSVKVRWLAGDALATEGKFRRAVEQYLMVLKSIGGEPGANPGTLHTRE